MQHRSLSGDLPPIRLPASNLELALAAAPETVPTPEKAGETDPERGPVTSLVQAKAPWPNRVNLGPY